MNQPHDPTTAALISLGCPKALVDSERILAGLAIAGFTITDEADGADVVLVNTCGFIDLARAESDAVLKDLAARKRAGRLGRIVVVGCLAQRDGPRLLDRHPDVDVVAGLAERDSLAALCRAAASDRNPSAGLVRVGAHPATAPEDRERLRLTPRHYAYLRLAEGCDHRCTYCTIPSIRGPLRSKPLPRVLAEAKELVADGARELILIGQDTTAYGRDLGAHANLAGLLATLRNESGADWLRLLYAHPDSISKQVVDELAKGLPIVPYLDLPIQHADDHVLRSMGRRTTRTQIEDLIGRLRHAAPPIALRTSLIVGFPGETEAAFQTLLEFVEKVRFDHVGSFVYSPEEGTPAARLPEQVPAKVRRRRWERLMRLADRLGQEAARKKIGRTLQVRVDGPDPENRRRLLARHAGQAPEIDSAVLLKTDGPAGQWNPGEKRTVRITDTKGLDLLGEPDGEKARRRPTDRSGRDRKR